MLNIGSIVRERRLALGMTQEELAHKCGYKSRSSINKIELQRDIPIRKLKPIADVLDISMIDLLNWQEEPQGSLSHIDTSAVAELMLNPSNAKLISVINEMDDGQKEELYNYANYLMDKKNKRG